MRYIWLALFCLFIGIASYLAEDLFFPTRPPFPEGTFESAIHKDFEKLETAKSLPQELKNLKAVYFLDHRTQKTPINWSEISKLHFPQHQDGRFDLQIEAFDTGPRDADSGRPEIILQYGLFDSASKNKIWEISRSFPISEKRK